MPFNAASEEHGQKTSNSGASISKDSPLYYSYATISENEQKIIATEEEAFSGNQAWDMNPVIYYRVKKPVDNLDLLPKMNLAEHFTQSEESESVSFTIQDETINPAEIAAIEITDQVALNRFEAFKSFTTEQDAEILKELDKQISAKGTNIKDCKSGMFFFAKSILKSGSRLETFEEKVINMRM